MYAKKFLQLASDIAETSVRFGNAKVGAILVYRNKVVSYATNGGKSNPFFAKYGKNEYAIYPHAETKCLWIAQKLGFEKFNMSTLYVARVKQDNSMALSKPCNGCERAIRDFSIQRVVYTIDDAYYGTMEVL